LIPALAAPLLGKSFSILLRTSGANATNTSFYAGVFDLPGYNCLLAPTVSSGTIVPPAQQGGCALYAGTPGTNPPDYPSGFYYTTLTPGLHGAFLLNPDLSGKASLDGGSVVACIAPPGPVTTPTNIGLSPLTTTSPLSASDYWLNLVAIFIGDVSANLRTLSA
jgi:hypothetical protein